MSIGEWENRKYTEHNVEENLHFKFNEDLSWCPPKGESLQKVSDRSLAAFDQITDTCSAEDTILVVSHGALLAILLALSLIHISEPTRQAESGYPGSG